MRERGVCGLTAFAGVSFAALKGRSVTAVENVVRDPSGTPVAFVVVTIRLMTGTGVGYVANAEYVGAVTTVSDSLGHWSIDLPGNATLTPANTYYTVTESTQELSATTDIIVPSSGGPYYVSSILATPVPVPASLAITGVQIAADGTVAGSRPQLNVISGTNTTISAADNPTSNRVDLTVTSTAGGAGPASTVTDAVAYGVAKAVGAATSYAREDHAHGSQPVPYAVEVYNVPGTLAPVTGTARVYNDAGRTLTIRAVRASVGTAPTGASVIVDVKTNGVTIFTTQANRPTIAAGTQTSGKVTNMDVTAFADGGYLTVDIAQVGASVAGADLTLQIWLG